MPSSSSDLRKSYDHMFKIIIVGKASVGKTCFMNRYCEGEYSDKYQPTIGADYRIHSMFKHDRRIKLQIWDTTGQERFQSLTKSYFRNAHGVILMYDITVQDTFDDLPTWMELINENTPKKRKIILVGNKVDMEENRVVPYDKGLAYAESIGASYQEASSKTNKNIVEIFDLLVDQIFFSKKRTITGDSIKGEEMVEEKKGGDCKC